MRRLFLILPLSAVIIGGLIAYKLTRPPVAAVSAGDVPLVAGRAPLFELYDEHSQIVRLARYLGRHKLLVVFFDGARGPDKSELLQQLRDSFPQIRETKAVLLAVSTLRPAEHRQGAERGAHFPFPMLSDIDERVHQQWGAYDSQTEKTREAVFVIDRGGVIRHVHRGPENLGTPADWNTELNRVP